MSLMQQAAYKCGTPQFELKSSATFELLNVVNGQKLEKLLSLNKAQKNLRAKYGPISFSGRRVVDFWIIVSQKQPLTPKYIHQSSTSEYICSLYHKESQYVAKLRQIKIDLYKLKKYARRYLYLTF